jgi:hypothetical protein
VSGMSPVAAEVASADSAAAPEDEFVDVVAAGVGVGVEEATVPDGFVDDLHAATAAASTAVVKKRLNRRFMARRLRR